MKYLAKAFANVINEVIISEEVQVKVAELEAFVRKVLIAQGLSAEDACITADVLILADRRGIGSHGVARLKRYVDGIKNGVIRTCPNVKTVHETPVSLVIDGDGGMGQPLTYRTMQRCLEKARTNFMCFASIRNSNHYGIAGYYVLMALAEGMIGVSLTNTTPLTVPTFGRNVTIGTNPIAIGFPGKDERPFLLDMATSTVPRGKLEVYARKEKPIPDCWACDASGQPSTNAAALLDDMINRRGGGLLPLGGGDELTGGHKGYGLSAMVDILCGVLSGGMVGPEVARRKNAPAGVAHFIGVINPAAFLGAEAIGEGLDAYIRTLRNADKAAGQERIFVAGEKEYEFAEKYREFVPLQKKVFDILNNLGNEIGLSITENKKERIECE